MVVAVVTVLLLVVLLLVVMVAAAAMVFHHLHWRFYLYRDTGTNVAVVVVAVVVGLTLAFCRRLSWLVLGLYWLFCWSKSAACCC